MCVPFYLAADRTVVGVCFYKFYGQNKIVCSIVTDIQKNIRPSSIHWTGLDKLALKKNPLKFLGPNVKYNIF